MERKRCEKRGHSWAQSALFRGPVQFCRRWFCQYSRVNPLIEEGLRIRMEKLGIERGEKIITQEEIERLRKVRTESGKQVWSRGSDG